MRLASSASPWSAALIATTASTQTCRQRAQQVLFLWIGPSHVFPTFALGFELVSLGSKVFE